jgi:Uma2 family endonuclease
MSMGSAARVSQPAPHEVLGQRLNLRGIDWATYRKISDALAGRHLRLTFDRGMLEFTTISSLHSRISRLFSRMVLVLAKETGLPLGSYGDMTCSREDLQRALEADESFYIENEKAVRNKEKIDLDVDPPPDLAVEIDITPHSPTRLSLYASLGVSEVWRYDGNALEFFGLTDGKKYVLLQQSRHFPIVEPGDLLHILPLRSRMDEVELNDYFHSWVRKKLKKAKPRKRPKRDR